MRISANKRQIPHMKLTNIENVDKFFEVINSCKGKVELVSEEGDRESCHDL